MKNSTLKIILLVAWLLSGLICFCQAAPTGSPNTMRSYTYTQAMSNADNIQLYNAMRLIYEAVSGGTVTPWGITGNTLGSNAKILGSLDNRSLRIVTNSIERAKFDTLGRFIFRNPTAGKLTIRDWNVLNTYIALYAQSSVNTNSNVALVMDSTLTVLNSYTDLVLRSRGQTMITLNSYDNTTQPVYGFAGFTFTGINSSEKQSWNVPGDNIQFTAGNQTRCRGRYFQGATYSATTATTYSWTSNFDIDAPTNGSLFTATNRWAIKSNGNSVVTGLFCIGQPTMTPTAQIHIGALGLTTASKAPLKLATPGSSLMATPEAGAFEVDANGDAYYTPVASRYKLATVLTNTATLDFANTLAATSSDLTITVTGAAVGDAVFLGAPASPNINSCLTSFVSAANTVTVRFNNYSAAAIDPASATYKVVVNKN